MGVLIMVEVCFRVSAIFVASGGTRRDYVQHNRLMCLLMSTRGQRMDTHSTSTVTTMMCIMKNTKTMMPKVSKDFIV